MDRHCIAVFTRALAHSNSIASHRRQHKGDAGAPKNLMLATPEVDVGALSIGDEAPGCTETSLVCNAVLLGAFRVVVKVGVLVSRGLIARFVAIPLSSACVFNAGILMSG